jgi:hypothetical protein
MKFIALLTVLFSWVASGAARAIIVAVSHRDGRKNLRLSTTPAVSQNVD